MLVLLKFYCAPDIVEFVLRRFSHFNIAIAITLHSVEPELQVFVSSLENCPNFSKTSTPRSNQKIKIHVETLHITAGGIYNSKVQGGAARQIARKLIKLKPSLEN